MRQFFDEIRRLLPAGLGLSQNTIQATITITGDGANMASLEVPPEAHLVIKLLKILGYRVDDQDPVTPAWLIDQGCEGIGEGIFEWQFRDDDGADSWVQFEPAEENAEIHSNVIVACKTRQQARALMTALAGAAVNV